MKTKSEIKVEMKKVLKRFKLDLKVKDIDRIDIKYNHEYKDADEIVYLENSLVGYDVLVLLKNGGSYMIKEGI